jgi:hypothetical protein
VWSLGDVNWIVCNVCMLQVVESVRRILLTGVLGVVAEGTAVQVVVGMVLLMVFIRMYSMLGA